jgi:hypothetical protein
MGVNINEAWRHHETLHINLGLCLSGDSPDLHNAPFADSDIREESRVACAINDPAIPDDDVIGFRTESEREQSRQAAN